MIEASHDGPLTCEIILKWLYGDGRIDKNTFKQLARRLHGTQSAQHPLLRIASLDPISRHGQPLDTDYLCRWLAGLAGLEFLHINPLKADVGRVGEIMSMQYAQRYGILPIKFSPTECIIATAQPFERSWIPQVEHAAKQPIRLVFSNPEDIARYTVEFFSLAHSVRAAQSNGNAIQGATFEQLVELGSGDRQVDANDQGIIRLVDWLWQYAFTQRASDIHLEPRREIGNVRFRIDGVLHTVYQLPMGVMNAVLSRIKLLGRMDVVEKRRPLDGRIKTRSPEGNEVEMRLSTMPTAFGEKMVMRIFDPDVAVKDAEGLGFSPKEAAQWHDITHRPNGIVLVTGPTGSGKTTTLYSTLKRLASNEINLCTIEDPIELIENDFNQTQVQPELGVGFAEGVRALMRQDPDVIMIGEIRDEETAAMAVQAALTGHLVFSTLHTNDAPSAITRLLDLKVPGYLLGATLLGILAQRLVRTLCPDCKEADERFNIEEARAMAKPWNINGEFHPCRPVGCIKCRNTGFRGRVGIYELLLIDEKYRRHLSREPNLDALRRAAIDSGLKPMRLEGLLRVAQGITTIGEVVSNTPPIELGQAG
ncbi:MAG: GspE/PulE family protein [Azoarcus sp.]|nr:GspE/PulE family protein [Azoarcus sp.]